jgi:hypothetical protein
MTASPEAMLATSFPACPPGSEVAASTSLQSGGSGGCRTGSYDHRSRVTPAEERTLNSGMLAKKAWVGESHVRFDERGRETGHATALVLDSTDQGQEAPSAGRHARPADVRHCPRRRHPGPRWGAAADGRTVRSVSTFGTTPIPTTTRSAATFRPSSSVTHCSQPISVSIADTDRVR